MDFDGKRFLPYDEYYFVSADGDVYSKYKKGLLKPYIDHDGYKRVDIHSKHMKIHRLVFLVWVGAIPNGFQINHKDDNKSNNNYSNLYLGSQKENVSDCISNKHRVGHMASVVVYDKLLEKIIEFPSIKDFLLYTGHNISNESLSHVKDKKWFNQRFVIIQKEGVTTIESYKSIRAIYDSGIENKAEKHEASRVGRSLSPLRSARDIQNVC